jgi:protein-tyrosine kinase
VNLNPRDPIAEVYRSIRTKLLFSSTEENPLKSILITSPGPQEGKTLSLCNLGIALAQNQKRVLLIDADMRKPRLHEVFKKDNVTGLSSILSGQAAFNDIIQKTDIANLHIISGGVIPPDPSELLASHKAKESIAKAVEKFDFVLIDSPPIGMLADAAILSKIVDGLIVVVQSGKTSGKVLGRVCQIINESKAHVAGLLLNKIFISQDQFGYYSYYYGKSSIPSKPKSVSMQGSFYSDMITEKVKKQISVLIDKLSSILKKDKSKK